MANLISFLRGNLLYIVAFVLGIWLTYSFIGARFLEAADPSAQPQAFFVEKGWGLQNTAKKLEEKGLINSWWGLYFIAKFDKEFKAKDGEAPNIFPGEYKVSAAMSPKELLRVFIDRNLVYHDFTIPEGFTGEQIAQLMANTGLTDLARAEAAINDKATIARYGIPANTLEGYLFPETYRFTRPDDEKIMVERMVAEGFKRRTKAMMDRATELGFTMHQILTLASVIEKETGAPEERTTISSVFHNRLRIGMPLQSDPTVIYGVKNFDGNLTKKHLNAPGPYNTYLNTGLPPTPIANPGIESINAALNPADTDFLYFVSRNDGTHKFSASYREHRKAVKTFQKTPWQPERAVKEPSAKKKPAAKKRKPRPKKKAAAPKKPTPPAPTKGPAKKKGDLSQIKEF